MPQFNWTCPVCQMVNVIDQGDGYEYIAAYRCTHAKEILADYKAWRKFQKKRRK